MIIMNIIMITIESVLDIKYDHNYDGQLLYNILFSGYCIEFIGDMYIFFLFGKLLSYFIPKIR